jgi:hypothetical protein
VIKRDGTRRLPYEETSMRELKFDHVFNCDAETYWDQVFFSEEFNHALFRDFLSFTKWEQTITEKTDDVIKRTVVVQPPVGEVPKAVKKVLGDNFGYKEHGTFDRSKKRYKIDIESNVAREKTHVHGEIWLEPAGENKSRRIAKFTIEVKIMVVGKLVEDQIAGNMTRDFERGSKFTNDWLKKKGL